MVTVREQLQEKYGDYAPYSEFMKKVDEREGEEELDKFYKRNIREAQGLAVNAIADEEGLETEQKTLSQSTDRDILSTFINIGYDNTKNPFIEHARDNLEEILNETPEANKEMIFSEIEPKTNTRNRDYNKTAKIQKEYIEKFEKIKNDDVSEMKEEILLGYEETYKDRADLIDGLKLLADSEGDEFIKRKYSQIVLGKRKEFRDSLGDNVIDYLNTVIPTSRKEEMYEILAKEVRTQER